MNPGVQGSRPGILLPVNHLKVSNIPPKAAFSISGCPECLVWNAGREQEATDTRCCDLDPHPSCLCAHRFSRGQRSAASMGSLFHTDGWTFALVCVLLLLNLGSPRWTHCEACPGDLNRVHSSLSASAVTCCQVPTAGSIRMGRPPILQLQTPLPPMGSVFAPALIVLGVQASVTGKE